MGTASLIFLAFIAGLAVTLQGQFMGLMDRALGTKESIFITYASGGLIITLLMLTTGWGNLKNWQGVPWYAYSAGILGLIIVGTIGYVIPRLGVAKGFMLIVVSQFVIAALIDHYGFFGAAVRPLDLGRLLGLSLMLIGVWIVVR